MVRKFQLLGIAYAGIAVILGAFGAHALKSVLTADQIATFETGVKYQFLHGLALLVLSLFVTQHMDSKWLQRAGIFISVGVVLFSGSIYILATRSLFPFTVGNWIGPVTPLGGLCFILGWISWAVAIIRG